MNLISSLLGQVLEFIYNLVNNYGLAIVLFTVVVKTILLPLTIKQTKSMKAMQDIQPKVQEIQNKYKDKPEKQNQEIMKLYQEAKINPMAGCLFSMLQLPLFIAFFEAVQRTPAIFEDKFIGLQLGTTPSVGITTETFYMYYRPSF